MDHIARDAVFAQIGGHLSHLFFGLVSDAAHPEAEGPERRHGAAASQRGVLCKDLLRIAQEDEEVERLVSGVNHVGLVEGLAEVESHRGAGVNEHTVAGAAHKEWDRLVHLLGLRAPSLSGEGVNLLPTFVESCERLSAAEDLFIGRETEAGRDAMTQIGAAADK